MLPSKQKLSNAIKRAVQRELIKASDASKIKWYSYGSGVHAVIDDGRSDYYQVMDLNKDVKNNNILYTLIRLDKVNRGSHFDRFKKPITESSTSFDKAFDEAVEDISFDTFVELKTKTVKVNVSYRQGGKYIDDQIDTPFSYKTGQIYVHRPVYDNRVVTNSWNVSHIDPRGVVTKLHMGDGFKSPKSAKAHISRLIEADPNIAASKINVSEKIKDVYMKPIREEVTTEAIVSPGMKRKIKKTFTGEYGRQKSRVYDKAQGQYAKARDASGKRAGEYETARKETGKMKTAETIQHLSKPEENWKSALKTMRNKGERAQRVSKIIHKEDIESVQEAIVSARIKRKVKKVLSGELKDQKNRVWKQGQRSHAEAGWGKDDNPGSKAAANRHEQTGRRMKRIEKIVK